MSKPYEAGGYWYVKTKNALYAFENDKEAWEFYEANSIK